MTLQPDCIARWDMDRDRSVLSEQRARGPHRPDFWERYAARAISASDMPVQVLEAFTLHDVPIFWFDAEAHDVAVDARFSSDLSVVDATSLRAGTRHGVGTLTGAATSLPARTVVELLVRADVIRTWAHMESTMCVEKEATAGPGWNVRVRGEHTFFTNRKNTRGFAFEVQLDAAGRIDVVGIE